MKFMKIQPVHSVTVYTGTGGQSHCHCKCQFCTQNYGSNQPPFYQGNIDDVKKLISAIPGLKEAYILGNPDPVVDPKFCNNAAKLFIKAGCKVMFSTSGIGGKRTMKTLLDGIPADMVKYVSFSVDSLKPDVTNFLKGVRLPLDQVESGIEFCIEKGIPVKIQPTLWTVNYEEVESLVTYFFEKFGIKWFTFHVGSLESYHGEENFHLPASTVRQVYKKVHQLQERYKLEIKMPLNMLTSDEFEVYSKEYTPHCKNPTPTDIQVWFTHKGILASYCSVWPSVNPSACVFALEKENLIAPGLNCAHCPVLKATLGPHFDTEGYTPVCLYYKP